MMEIWMTGRIFGNTMVMEENIQNDGDDNEEGTHTHLNYNKNYLMKVLMHYTDKHMKQETQISSMKRRHLALDGKAKEDEERKKESFYRMGLDEVTTENCNNDNTDIKTCTNNAEKSINWKRKYYDMRTERDM